MEFFATCPTGFERLLADELAALGTPRVRSLQGQVSFEGTVADAYRVCLWSHLASRVVAVVGRCGAASSDELYEGLSRMAWEEHVPGTTTFAVRASGTNAQLRTTQFVALRTKDALVDRLAARTGTRPVANPKSPDVGIAIHVARTRATVGIDLAGAPLFQRGYERTRAAQGLRPDYAAALLALAGWRELCAQVTPVLADLAPTSATLLAEAALQAARRAPGLLRLRWGFAGWAQHSESTWQRLANEARAQAASTPPATLVALPAPKTPSRAADLCATLRTAGVQAELRVCPADDAAGLPAADLLTCDLSRLFSDELVQESAALGLLARTAEATQATRIATIARDALASAFLRQEPAQRLASVLGKEAVFLNRYESRAQASTNASASPTVELAGGREVPVLVAASDQFATRLRKVARQRAKWARREDVTCYRVYDADLPDYAVALDLYQGTNPQTGETSGRRWLQVAEYAAPKSVDADLARMRLLDVLAIAPAVLDVEPRDVFLRVRRHAKGGSQYADEAQTPRAGGPGRAGQGSRRNDRTALPPGAHLIDEGGLVFEVNFSSRLDCGIFLDHRDTRALLREMAKQTKGSKRFLNLFAYTGTATCYAADGGMRHTTTVDLSRPSLDWARRNMERNGFVGPQHEFVQADVVRWVGEQRHTRNRWDLVFCDVPTFSNSKGMGRRSFDVQRDHAELLIGVSRLLTRDGTCVFSCNLRTFSPDVDKLARAGVQLEDITAQTIPADFARNPRIHHAYLVRRAPR